MQLNPPEKGSVAEDHEKLRACVGMILVKVNEREVHTIKETAAAAEGCTRIDLIFYPECNPDGGLRQKSPDQQDQQREEIDDGCMIGARRRMRKSKRGQRVAVKARCQRERNDDD